MFLLLSLLAQFPREFVPLLLLYRFDPFENENHVRNNIFSFAQASDPPEKLSTPRNPYRNPWIWFLMEINPILLFFFLKQRCVRCLREKEREMWNDRNGLRFKGKRSSDTLEIIVLLRNILKTVSIKVF